MFQQIPLNVSLISGTAVDNVVVIEHDMVLLMQSLHFTEKELKYSFINRRRHFMNIPFVSDKYESIIFQ